MKDQIITVTTCPYSKAQLIKARLEGAGIECFLSNINLIQPGIASGVQIKINEKDVDEALPIIEQMKGISGQKKHDTVTKMKSIRRILVPVDFSETSLKACSFALGLAQILKAEVKLLYSYFNPIMNSEPYLEGHSFNFMIDDAISGVEAEAKKQMTELKNRLKRQTVEKNLNFVRIGSSLDRGLPEAVVLKYIDSWKPGIVVMGTRGAGNSVVNYLGSVTKKVMEKATIPVLLIPEKSIFSGMQHIHRVLYATNFDESDFRSLRKLMTLVRPFNMAIHIVHISVDKTDSLDQARMNILKTELTNEYDDFNFTCDVISHADIPEGLQEYIENKEIDLLALTTHKRGLIERFFNPSLAKKMVFHSYVPLLVFHS